METGKIILIKGKFFYVNFFTVTGKYSVIYLDRTTLDVIGFAAPASGHRCLIFCR